MISILHISDPHFGAVTDGVRDALAHFADVQKPDVVLLSGDVTQRARRGQFARAQAFIGRFSAPVVAVPGNHDIPLFNLWARYRNPYANYRAALGGNLEPELEAESLLVISVNTTRASRHKNGEVSAAQIARVAQRLQRARPGQLRIVMQHHPVRAAVASDVANLVIGRESAVPAWVDAGMDLLLAGHVHLPYVGVLRGMHGRSAWTAQAGTAVSSRTRGAVPNSVNVIRYELSASNSSLALNGGRCCVVERWDYAALECRFIQVESERLQLDA